MATRKIIEKAVQENWTKDGDSYSIDMAELEHLGMKGPDGNPINLRTFRVQRDGEGEITSWHLGNLTIFND